MLSLADTCKAKKLRITKARLSIVQALDDADDHPDALTIHARAKQHDPRVSQASVYRTLKWLETLGLIKKLDFGEGRFRYESAQKPHHNHLVDLGSGEILEFDDQELALLARNISARLGFVLSHHRVDLFGYRSLQMTDSE
ncbi:MAG: Fur family transcriptional regulator [Pseudomonadota bacterium]